jgi:hypothetical protein
MLRPTPPGVVATVPGLLVAGTSGAAVRALMSMLAPPTTTTLGSLRTRYARPRISPRRVSCESATATEARVLPMRSASAAASRSGLTRNRSRISRSRGDTDMFTTVSTDQSIKQRCPVHHVPCLVPTPFRPDSTVRRTLGMRRTLNRSRRLDLGVVASRHQSRPGACQGHAGQQACPDLDVLDGVVVDPDDWRGC